MPASSDIYGQIQQSQAPNMLAQLAQAMQVKGLQGQNELAQYTIGKARRGDGETNALANLLKGGLDLSTADGQRQAYGVAPTVAPGYIKANTESQTAQANLQRLKQDASVNAVKQHRDALAGVRSPQDAATWVQDAYKHPDLASITAQVPVEQALSRIPQDPQGFQNWINQQALGMTKYVELNKPTVHMQDTGGTSNVISTPGLGGAPTVLSTTAKTQTPDSIASNATSRANNRDTIAAENARAGVTAGGGVDENTERTAQAIASGQLPAPTGMALLNPKNQRILGRVMEINPQYDSTTVDAKKKAARDFTSGTQGNAMRSFAVAGQHLDQLGTLVDALGNGNMQIVNKIGNAISQQTGSPAVTNFDAAKDVVSKEVIKAIVAGGGGVSEREELSKLMANAKSPAQLKGVIQQYRNLMGAQHDALLTQRRAAGLPDSTMPKYSDANGSPNAPEVPADIAAILAKHGSRKGM